MTARHALRRGCGALRSLQLFYRKVGMSVLTGADMYKDKKIAAIVVRAGKGTRMGFDKMLVEIEGKSVVRRSVEALSQNALVDEIIIAAGDNIEGIKKECGSIGKVSRIVRGGKTRNISVKNALARVKDREYVAIHDGARPFVSQRLINDVIRAGCEYGAAIPAVGEVNTVKVVENGFVSTSLDRSRIYAVQTPQVFSLRLYRELSSHFEDDSVTDDSQIFEKAGRPVKVVEGDRDNIKLTTKEDLRRKDMMRIGHGYDVHRLVEGRPLIMGGVTIPYEKGLDGHSDRDVVVHAVIDALMGAANIGDIGGHFPDSDERYRGADSLKLLRETARLIKEEGYGIVNVDVTILCQRPKLAPYKNQMAENMATAMGIDPDCVSVKATTEEGLGFTGKGEGIACHSVALISR